AANELKPALVPRAFALARHLAAGTPGARLHVRLALPLAGERFELLDLGTGLRRLLSEDGRACESGREHDERTRNLHVTLLNCSANATAAAGISSPHETPATDARRPRRRPRRRRAPRHGGIDGRRALDRPRALAVRGAEADAGRDVHDSGRRGGRQRRVRGLL